MASAGPMECEKGPHHLLQGVFDKITLIWYYFVHSFPPECKFVPYSRVMMRSSILTYARSKESTYE